MKNFLMSVALTGLVAATMFAAPQSAYKSASGKA